MMTGEETDERDELEAQFQTATEGLQRAVMRVFQDSDIHPHVMVLALARVTVEVGAGTAFAGRGLGGRAGPGGAAGRAGRGRAPGRAWTPSCSTSTPRSPRRAVPDVRPP